MRLEYCNRSVCAGCLWISLSRMNPRWISTENVLKCVRWSTGGPSVANPTFRLAPACHWWSIGGFFAAHSHWWTTGVMLSGIWCTGLHTHLRGMPSTSKTRGVHPWSLGIFYWARLIWPIQIIIPILHHSHLEQPPISRCLLSHHGLLQLTTHGHVNHRFFNFIFHFHIFRFCNRKCPRAVFLFLFGTHKEFWY